jgi:hypothetical protein
MVSTGFCQRRVSGWCPAPRPAFDAKEPLIVVSDDEEERRGLLSHNRPRAFFQAAAKLGATS